MKILLSIVRAIAAGRGRIHSRNVFISASIIALFMLACAGFAGAEEEQFPDRFQLRLGGYAIQNADSIVRIDAANLPVGTYVDFANTLGGDTRDSAVRLDGYYRFNDRHAITYSWYDAKFTGSRVLQQEINWDGQTYTIGTQVDSRLEFNVYKLGYQYSVYHNDKAELGASFGLHIMRISTGISATGISQSASEAVTAPMPVWGLFADYKFTPRFSAYYNYQFFFIDYQDKIRGGLQDFLFGLEYRVIRNLALGVAYDRYALNIKAKRSDSTTLYVDSGWNGGMVYAAVYF